MYLMSKVRKFLVDPTKLPPRRDTEASYYEHFYLSFDLSVRIRIVTLSADDYTRVHLEILSPSEHETNVLWGHLLSLGEVDDLRPYSKGGIKRHRHSIQYEGESWYVFEYFDRHAGLWLAEVFPLGKKPLSLPPWVTKEVTDDAQYTEHALDVGSPSLE